MVAFYLASMSAEEGDTHTVKTDPLAHLSTRTDVAEALGKAREAINAVHRRPVNLRKVEITSSEATLRGAKVAADLAPQLSEQQVISAFSVLAPGTVEESARIFLRSPLQIFARLDVALGGTGQPVKAPEELELLGRVISAAKDNPLLAAVVQGEVASKEFFGIRSTTIAAVAARLAAVASGLDPRGLCVPETYVRRHRKEFDQAIEEFRSPDGVENYIVLHLAAWEAGAAEAESIARAAS